MCGARPFGNYINKLSCKDITKPFDWIIVTVRRIVFLLFYGTGHYLWRGEGGVNIMGGQKYFLYEKGGDHVLFKVLIKGGWKIDHSIFEMALQWEFDRAK